MNAIVDTRAGALRARTQRSTTGADVARAKSGPPTHLATLCEPGRPRIRSQSPHVDGKPSEEDHKGDLEGVRTHHPDELGQRVELRLGGACRDGAAGQAADERRDAQQHGSGAVSREPREPMQQVTSVGEPRKWAGASEHGDCNSADEGNDCPEQRVGSLMPEKRPERGGDDESGKHRRRAEDGGCRPPQTTTVLSCFSC